MKFTILLIVGIFLSSCVTRGDLKNPINPISSYENTGKTTATVKFYRTTPLSGTLHIGDFLVTPDYEEDYDETKISEDLNTNKVMIANRSNYMVQEFSPGVHTFSFRGPSKQVVKLERGLEYYLAVTFTSFPILEGIPGLEFKNKRDFLKETKNDTEVEFINKCNFWSGCDYHEVKWGNQGVGVTDFSRNT